jgi:FtsH-binding integral membrane protein
VDIVFAILTGAGLGAAAGIRPFLPALVAGAFASGDLLVDFDGTDLSFLEQTGWLLAVILVLIALVFVQRRIGSEKLDAGPLGAAVGGIALGVGALLFAGALADETSTWWPGIVGGLVCAALAAVTTRELLRRTRSRLDPDAREALTVYADGASLVVAVLAIVAPPVSILAIGFLAWLLVSGRRRAGQKYAGLRILRD